MAESYSPDRYLSIQQVAQRLNIGQAAVRDWVRTGRLPATKIGTRVWRVREVDLERFLAAQQQSPAREAPTNVNAALNVAESVIMDGR